VAVHLFAERGFAATGIRDLARAAGIAASVLYNYFATKEDLLADIMRTSLAALFEGASRALASEARPERRLAILAEVHVAMQAIDTSAAMVVDSELRALRTDQRHEIIGLRDRYEQLWRETLKAGVETGQFEVRELHLTRLAMLGMCNEVAWWFTDRGPFTLAEVMELYADLVLKLVQSASVAQLRTADVGLPPAASIIELVVETRDELWRLEPQRVGVHGGSGGEV
jgi:AcrR family transcriptional regulator